MSSTSSNDDTNSECSDAPSLDHLSDHEVELFQCRQKKQKQKTKKTNKSKKSKKSKRTRHGGSSSSQIQLEQNNANVGVLIEDEHNSSILRSDVGADFEYFSREESEPSNDEDVLRARKDVTYPIHDPSTHWKLKKPFIGERYESPQQLKDCINFYLVANGYRIWYKLNKRSRLQARCGKKPNESEGHVCRFRLWASWMNDEKTFQVKTMIDKHTCSRNFNLGSMVTSKWIAKQFADRIKQNPRIKLSELKAVVMKKYKVRVSDTQCSRARARGVYDIEQNLTGHYSQLFDYAAEITRSNPGSTVKVNVIPLPDGQSRFYRFYVCFNGLKEGWIGGCRKVIGLDGCFLKGLCKGKLLTAVGRDANNQIYPVAWAVVEVENKDNWTWFVNLVKNDLGLNNGKGVFIISDQHKGLLESIVTCLPDGEHRECARHVYANFCKKYNGVKFKNLFWAAAKATYVRHFERVLNEIKEGNSNAYNDLMGKRPIKWSRAFFITGSDCDSVENGMSECFNSNILEARRKPIIDMLEDIRTIVMKRFGEMRKEGQKWSNEICPSIRKRIEINTHIQRFWEVFSSGNQEEFEVRSVKDAYVVDLGKKTCTCRHWELSGIPCPHAVATIIYINKDISGFVSDNFKKSKFMAAYMYPIRGMNGQKDWPSTNNIPILPPIERQMPGRPKVKRRRHATEEGHSVRTKAGTCHKCWEKGHNSRTCTGPAKEPPPKEVFSIGRPRAESVRGGRSTSVTRGRGVARGRGAARGTSIARGKCATSGRGRGRGRGRGGASLTDETDSMISETVVVNGDIVTDHVVNDPMISERVAVEDNVYVPVFSDVPRNDYGYMDDYVDAYMDPRMDAYIANMFDENEGMQGKVVDRVVTFHGVDEVQAADLVEVSDQDG